MIVTTNTGPGTMVCNSPTSFKNPPSSFSNSLLQKNTRSVHSIRTANSLSSSNSNFFRFIAASRRNLARPVTSLKVTSSAEFPLLPFEASDVLVPSESKTLHLYEARFLALLEESLSKRKNLFVHFVLDPVLTSASPAGVPFAARFGCLVLIEKVEKLEIGALVSIRGIGRVKIMKFVQADPYLKGVITPLQDDAPNCISDVDSRVSKMREALCTLNSLQIKLKAPKDELLQTQISNSLRWAEREPFIENYERYIPALAERVSFAGLQPVSGATRSELLDLQRLKLGAMETRDTMRRLEDSIQLIEQNISLVAAKLAIQSLEV